MKEKVKMRNEVIAVNGNYSGIFSSLSHLLHSNNVEDNKEYTITDEESYESHLTLLFKKDKYIELRIVEVSIEEDLSGKKANICTKGFKELFSIPVPEKLYIIL